MEDMVYTNKVQTAVFPTEIFDLVIDDLAAAENRKDLLACSLVSKSFHFRVKHHLFATLQLLGGPQFQSEYNRKQKGWLQTLLNLLGETDRLGTAGTVQTLVLGNIFKDVAQLFRPCWLLMDPTVPSILQRLSGVRKFVFKNVIRTIRWGSFSEELSSSILRLCASPSLTSLELQNITRLPYNLLPCSSNLESLSLIYTAIVWKPTEEDFILFPPNFELVSLKNLRNLSITIGAPFTNSEAECRLVLPNLCQMLRIDKSYSSPIEVLNITIGYEILFDCDDNGSIDAPNSRSRLDDLDAVLSNPKFSHLKTVNLNIACKRLGQSLDPKLQKHIQLHAENILPDLRSMSSITFSMKLTDYVF
ncbi:hypothetical protein JR316_0008929 [Psilocybe cubensis]|uniref:F-box domain-containing protein n=2 Tax=Psilocybe cubensis TaxID=181762 RepID=A0A8H7XUF8_PSICU|nr:hypothetical protein JR316_0008929 [Psilocybe cubensis]KAH9478474.1 hypothetical protein JR316_0008929 [Psilocybe cubensis]